MFVHVHKENIFYFGIWTCHKQWQPAVTWHLLVNMPVEFMLELRVYSLNVVLAAGLQVGPYHTAPLPSLCSVPANFVQDARALP